MFSRVSFGVRAASPAGQSYLIRFRYRMTDVLPPLLSDGRAANFVVSHAGYIYVGARARTLFRDSLCPSKTLPEHVYHNTCRWCNHVKHRRRDIARRCAWVNKFNVASRGSPQFRVKQQSASLFFYTPRRFAVTAEIRRGNKVAGTIPERAGKSGNAPVLVLATAPRFGNNNR